MLISPKTIYQITESWKSNSINEPSPIYCMSIRVGGGAFFIIGIASLILPLFD